MLQGNNTTIEDMLYIKSYLSQTFCFLDTALDYLYFTLDYHSEDNEQTKHTNQNLDQYLCVYCNYQQNN